ncbi:MAG TPA: hypothetical protein VEQ40_12660 [Pyrinomonadaceae bacterium]|nr:hypothetical protein [Pyrinomonadaceae bacterium]
MSQNPPSQDAPHRAQFALHKIIDEQHQRMVVATFEYPHDWTARSNVMWNYENVARPMIAYAATSNPNGIESFEFLPVEAYYWLDAHLMPIPGEFSMGKTCVAPMRALDALVQLAIPKYRGNRQNLRVVHAEVVPNLAQALDADELQGVQNEGVRARIEYYENGQMFEEDFYACAYWLPPNGGQTNWGLARLACFRAASGQLDAMRRTFLHILTSWRTNPQWQQMHTEIGQQLFAEFKGLHEVIRRKHQAEVRYGQQLAEYHQDQLERQQQRMNDLFAADERKRQQQDAQQPYGIADARGDVLMGRTAVDDPYDQSGNPHYDYGHHKAHWTNGIGDWIDTDDVNYDPNADPDVRTNNWVRAPERKFRS